VLVSVLGGLLGVVIALAGVRALVTLHPAVGGVPISTVLLDWITLLWMTGISIAAGIAFGIVPALAALTPQNTVRGISRLASRHALRGVLVTAQVALSLVLLAGAALLLNSSIRLANQDRGIEPRGILAFNFRIPVEDYLRNRGSYRGLPVSEAKPPTLALQRVFERLRVIPGVESAAGQSIAPLNIAVLPRMAILPEGRPVADEDISRGAMDSVYFLATPGVFRTMKGTVRRGRDFSDQDTASTPWVAVINETAARRFWPGEDPIGKRFTVDAVSGERPREVVGVVRDIPLRYVEPFSQPVIYTSYLQQAEMFHGAFANMFGQMTFLLRTSGDPMSLAPAVRAAVAEIDPDHPLADMVAEDEFVGADVRQRFYRAGAIGLFAFVAVLLAAIGVYGVMAHSVEQRRGEIGIRMALGASVREVVALIGRRAFVLVITGVVLGLGGALALSRLLQAQLWGITATDPTTFVGVSLLLVATAAAACFAPARRAARVDPAVTLRSE
jgi:putative ABC transport system permease protein